MFTGLIEDLGSVARRTDSDEGAELEIESELAGELALAIRSRLTGPA